MDLTKITATVRADEGSPVPVEMEFLVDPDAPISLVPGKVLDDLGVAPSGKETVELGGGAKAVRRVARVYFRVLGRGAYAKAAWGEAGEKPRLGHETMQACGLAIDPVAQVVRAPRPSGE